MADVIRSALGYGPAVIDSATATAGAVAARLREAGIARIAGEGSVHLLATDGPARFARLGKRFLAEALGTNDVELVDL